MTDDEPDVTARQLLHAATGDRDAEADVLAQQSHTDPDDAKLAVKRAHGDVTDRPKLESDLASPADVQVAESERRADPDSDR